MEAWRGAPMNGLILPMSLIAVLLIIAGALTYFVGWGIDTQINCTPGKGCGTISGRVLSTIWAMVAVGVVVIWNRFKV
jgi:hypothetical protein